MTGPSSVKSSTDDDDDNEIFLIFVLPVMDIELSRAVPRVNKNLKKKRKSTDVAVVQQFFNAFLLIHVRVFIFCLVSLFFFFWFIYFHRHFSTTTFYHLQCTARVSNVDRVIGVELTRLASIVS